MRKLKPWSSFLITPVVLSVSGFLTGGCSWFSEKDAATDPARVERTDAQIFVGDTIEMNYDPNVILKRAESFHEKEGYAEAIVEYQHFLELHRKHVLASYAQYKLALSHFKLIQTIDRDMTPVKKAQEEFFELMTAFPGSQYEAEARVKIRECEGFLAQHHLFVGQFYFRKESYLAAAKRFQMIIHRYPYLEESVEAKLHLARTYKDLGALEWSRDWAVALIQQHPQHELRADGLTLLAEIEEERPDLVVAQRLHTVNGNRMMTTFLPTRTTPSTRQTTLPGSAPSSTQSNVRASSTRTDCRLGSWCEETGTSLAQTYAPGPPGPDSLLCQPGTWCEETEHSLSHPPITNVGGRPPITNVGGRLPAPRLPGPESLLCRPGTWCE